MRISDTRSPFGSDVIADSDQRRQFDALCMPFRVDLMRFLFWLCHDQALAEDVMQETLLRAWRSFDSLQDRGAAKAWLLTIARRELARVFERKRLETVDVDTLGDTEQDALAANDSGVDSHDVEHLRRAIMQLVPSYREPLILQVLFGYSTQEIARHMELGLPAVLTRLFRARQLLRRQMLGAADDEESSS